MKVLKLLLKYKTHRLICLDINKLCKNRKINLENKVQYQSEAVNNSLSNLVYYYSYPLFFLSK